MQNKQLDAIGLRRKLPTSRDRAQRFVYLRQVRLFGLRVRHRSRLNPGIPARNVQNHKLLAF